MARTLSKTTQWYLKAAYQGNSYAQYALGYMYDEGENVEQNYKQAMCWYLKSADQGNGDAQNNIGIMYRDGNGVKQDSAQEKEWFSQSCDNGLELGCDTLQVFSE